jgi:hypothetical protein
MNALTEILHSCTRSRGYTYKTHRSGFKTLDFGLVRVGGLSLYSRAGRTSPGLGARSQLSEGLTYSTLQLSEVQRLGLKARHRANFTSEF